MQKLLKRISLDGFSKPVIVVLIMAFIFSFFFTYDYTDFSRNMSIGEGYVYTAKSLALSYNFNVDEYWGNAGVDVFTYGEHYFLPYAPLASTLMSIPYAVLQFYYYLHTHTIGPINGELSIVLESLAFGLLSSLALLFIGVLFVLLISKKDHKLLLISLVGLLLGTILFNYSVTFFNHLFAAFFVLLAYYLIIIRKKYLLAGIAIGFAFLSEFPTVLFALALGGYELVGFFKKDKPLKGVFRDLLLFSLGLLPFCFLLLGFNKYHYGGIFTFGEFLFKEQRMNHPSLQVHSFSQHPIYGLWGMYLSPLKGLFLYSPQLLFGVLYLRKVLSKKMLLGAIYVLITSLVYASWDDCFGATTHGTRYLITTIPFWAIWTHEFILEKNKYWKLAYTTALFYAVIVTVLGALSGIAWGVFGNCKGNMFIYAPYIRAKGHLISALSGDYGSVIVKYLFR